MSLFGIEKNDSSDDNFVLEQDEESEEEQLSSEESGTEDQPNAGKALSFCI